MKTLAVLTNGGDTCALNASLISIRENACHAGYKKIYGIRRGYQGLIDGSIDDITHKEIDPTIGGSCLGSQRVSPTRKNKTGEGYEIDETLCRQMLRCLKDYRVNVLVVIGGDGTLQATRMFQEWVSEQRSSEDFHEFQIIGFLKTIDNDIRTFTSFKGIEVSLCPGFPSAVKKISSCVEDLRVTARTAERAFSVETMGRDAGWLAAAATFGGAEILLVPEQLELWDKLNPGKRNLAAQDPKGVSKDLIAELTDEIVDFYVKNRNVLIAVGEGFEPVVEMPEFQQLAEIIRDLYGTRKKVGASELVTIVVSPVLEYYFLCLSRLCARRRDGADLSTRIESVLDETFDTPEAGKYREKMASGKNPLQDWDIISKLRTALGLGKKRVERSTSEQTSGDDQRGRTEAVEHDHLTVPPYKFEIRPHRTDYLPRSGPPSSYDYRFATVLGQEVGRMLVSGEFGAVAALREVVPYDQLTVDTVKTVAIEEIATQNFQSLDFFDRRFPFQVSERIMDFFRTIMTGPESLEKAICDISVLA